MSDVMLSLGDFVFGINTAAYEQLRRSTRWRWAAQQRLGRDPARQFLGSGDDAITLAGVIYTTFRGGLGQIQTLRERASQGVPRLMADSFGLIHGHWIIEGLDETQTEFFANGAPRKIEFNLSLKFYGETYP